MEPALIPTWVQIALPTVILVAITLIAAIAIASFVFGLFGTFTSTAQISASAVSYNIGSTGHEVNATGVFATAGCLIQLQNTGNSVGSGNACSFTGVS